MAGPFELALAEFAQAVRDKADMAVRGIVHDVMASIVERSPVDTGYFRANWRHGLDGAPEGTVPVVGTSESPAPPPDLPLLAAGSGTGHVHYIVNNASYAWALERGHSQQAPQGVVGLTVLEFEQIVREATAEARASTGAGQ